MEVALRRVLREAGARVVPNAQLRQFGVRGAPRRDGRNIEAAAFGLPLCHGLPLFVDITMASPLHADGTPLRGAASTDGVAIAAAESRKRERYPELAGASGGPALIVVACETGGRWSQDAVGLLAGLAQAKARCAPRLLRRSAELGWLQRWSSILAVAAQAALATSLLGGDPWVEAGRDGHSPSLGAVLSSEEPAFSRLPAQEEYL